RAGIVAGVGVSSQMNYLVINAVVGLSAGGSIVISQYFGAKKYVDVSKAVNTLITFLIVCGVALTVVTLLLSDSIIRLLKTPQAAFKEARDYFFYTMSGLVFIFVYNGIGAVLRGLGDSVRPLIFIGIAAALNIGLDVLAVAAMDMGAAGVAVATVVAHFISALISAIYLIKKCKKSRLDKFRFRMEKQKLKELLKTGVPTSIQNTVASLSFVALTYIINISYGDSVAALAAGSMAFKINSFAVLPSRSLNGSIAAMVGQNKGAGDKARIKNTRNYGLIIGLIFGFIFSAATFFFAESLLKIFNPDTQTLEMGTLYVKSFALDYVILPFSISQYGLTDGLGRTKVSMWVNSVSSLALRVPGAYVMGKLLGWGLKGIGYAIPLSSLFSAVIMFVYVRRNISKELKI
ncbi:MAG: MATE family efflux transporter, partial [Clostridia bacterium]|nr:MATE family efflux transporter [Clostridia bacterium]